MQKLSKLQLTRAEELLWLSDFKFSQEHTELSEDKAAFVADKFILSMRGLAQAEAEELLIDISTGQTVGTRKDMEASNA